MPISVAAGRLPAARPPAGGSLALLAALCFAALLPAAQELPRDRDTVRRDINARIDKFVHAKKSPTLGLLKEIIDLSISWGAGAYDDGDREGCYRFYRASIERLEKEFAADAKAAAEVRAALTDLQKALDASLTFDDIGKQAWALRYGFDKVMLEWSHLSDHQRALVAMGDKYFQLGLYRQSLDANTAATAALARLAGADVTDLSLGTRTAPLSCARAGFTLQDWKAAAGWLPVVLEFLPDLPTYPITPTQFYGEPDDHAAALKALELA